MAKQNAKTARTALALRNTVKNIMATANVPRGVNTNKTQRWCIRVPTAQAGFDIGRALSFALSDLPNSSELTSLYDFYQIDKIDFEWHLMAPLLDNANGITTYPVITYATDYDDVITPTSRNEIFEYGKACHVEQFSATRPVIKTTIIPRVANTIYQQGVTSAYSLAAPQTLIDAANDSVPHYGMKWWTDNYNTGAFLGGGILVFTRYHLTLVANR